MPVSPLSLQKMVDLLRLESHQQALDHMLAGNYAQATHVLREYVDATGRKVSLNSSILGDNQIYPGHPRTDCHARALADRSASRGDQSRAPPAPIGNRVSYRSATSTHRAAAERLPPARGEIQAALHHHHNRAAQQDLQIPR